MVLRCGFKGVAGTDGDTYFFDEKVRVPSQSDEKVRVPSQSDEKVRVPFPSGSSQHVTVPFARPTKPVYIRQLVRFVDAVLAGREDRWAWRKKCGATIKL
jgi:hypothetical protein